MLLTVKYEENRSDSQRVNGFPIIFISIFVLMKYSLEYAISGETGMDTHTNNAEIWLIFLCHAYQSSATVSSKLSLNLLGRCYGSLLFMRRFPAATANNIGDD